MNKIIVKFLMFFLIAIFSIFSKSYAIENNENKAFEISTKVNIECNGYILSELVDNTTDTSKTVKKNELINIKSEEPIGSIYIIYEMQSKKGNLQSENKTYYLGQNNFLHEYIELDDQKENKEISLTYDEDVIISEIHIFTKGEVPSWVQKWKRNDEKEADLLLFSTHSDDEHLFFLGLLPTYVAKGYEVQVAYVTNHNDNLTRLHEQLNGLWQAGITRYPTISWAPDAYSESLEWAITNLSYVDLGFDDIVEYEVEQIRKFKPLVIVGHDENGEYGHGQHILNTAALKEAIVKSKDETYDADSLEEYGIWECPKVYLHLYEQNKIVMNYDIPLEYFNGKTAYEMSKEAYALHLSQQYTWFTRWLKGKQNEYTKATDIETYKPTDFGLYYSTVGNDELKNDMFENIDKLKYRKAKENIEEKKEEELFMGVEYFEPLKEKDNITLTFFLEKENIIKIAIVFLTMLIIIFTILYLIHSNKNVKGKH